MGDGTFLEYGMYYFELRIFKIAVHFDFSIFSTALLGRTLNLKTKNKTKTKT